MKGKKFGGDGRRPDLSSYEDRALSLRKLFRGHQILALLIGFSFDMLVTTKPLHLMFSPNNQPMLSRKRRTQ
jgi:hypothetical protein